MWSINLLLGMWILPCFVTDLLHGVTSFIPVILLLPTSFQYLGLVFLKLQVVSPVVKRHNQLNTELSLILVEERLTFLL